jgi:hypothetical protein
MQSTKPFFQALETTLRSRLPHDEFEQVMDDSLWEYEACKEELRNANRDSASLARMASISIAFYRAMTKMGISRESALEALARSGECLNWTPTETTRQACPLAEYCRTKSAPEVCRAVFCASCTESAKGCALAGQETRDWSPAKTAAPHPAV